MATLIQPSFQKKQKQNKNTRKISKNFIKTIQYPSFFRMLDEVQWIESEAMLNSALTTIEDFRETEFKALRK